MTFSFKTVLWDAIADLLIGKIYHYPCTHFLYSFSVLLSSFFKPAFYRWGRLRHDFKNVLTHHNESGQTLVEYLLLVAAASVTAFLIISKGPIPAFTVKMLTEIKGAMQSIMRTAEIENGDVGYNDKNHPASKERLKAVHQ